MKSENLILQETPMDWFLNTSIISGVRTYRPILAKFEGALFYSGLFIIGKSFLSVAFVAGKNLVPNPATGKLLFELWISC